MLQSVQILKKRNNAYDENIANQFIKYIGGFENSKNQPGFFGYQFKL